MQYSLTWHGHANFQISCDGANGLANVLVDPFFEGNPSASTPWSDIAPPDLVLVTHDHGDHVGQAVQICNTTGALLGCIVGTAQRLLEEGLRPGLLLNSIGFNIGGTVTHKGISVTMTQAFHSSESGAPVGYIVTMPGGFTFYHAGDTGIFSSMELWGRLHSIDLAMLPIGGTFTMDARQAAMASAMLRTRSVVPMHWGTFPVLEQNTERFREQLRNHAPDCRLFDMKPGDTITLDMGEDGRGCAYC
ncbi:MAG: metal-dependent hydrolase [Desulfovibrio sp.]|nr:metal-dependent hydrolase [Desulfovibrio sp.]